MNDIPATDTIRTVLAELAKTATEAGDTRNANALNQADYQIGLGVLTSVQVSPVGDFLIPSKQAGGPVYRITQDLPCACTAGQNGKPCWHMALVEGILVARELVIVERDDETDYLDALALAAAPAPEFILAPSRTVYEPAPGSPEADLFDR